MKIFVFGSNLAGIHGAGSAQHARLYHGAIRGQGVGLQGNSYAIPTKDQNFNVLSLDVIRGYVNEFRSFVFEHPEMEFHVVAIGCGLAGFKPEQIAPMFAGLPDNCKFVPEFQQVLDNDWVIS